MKRRIIFIYGNSTGSVLVSPGDTDLEDDMEKQSGYYDNPWRPTFYRAYGVSRTAEIY
jgi:hypothetical protein